MFLIIAVQGFGSKVNVRRSRRIPHNRGRPVHITLSESPCFKLKSAPALKNELVEDVVSMHVSDAMGLAVGDVGLASKGMVKNAL